MNDFGTLLNLVSSGRATRPDAGESLTQFLMACHASVRRHVRLAAALGAWRECPARELRSAAAQCLRYFTSTLPLHLHDEADSVAPRLAGRSAALDATLTRMRAAHALYQVQAQVLSEALHVVLREPNQALPHRELARAAGAFEVGFEEHVRFEEYEIFPLLELLPDAEQTQIIEELRARGAY